MKFKNLELCSPLYLRSLTALSCKNSRLTSYVQLKMILLFVGHLTGMNNNNTNWKRWQLRCIATWRTTDIAPLILGCFWPNLYCACADTAISELPVKILTSLDTLTPISKKD